MVGLRLSLVFDFFSVTSYMNGKKISAFLHFQKLEMTCFSQQYAIVKSNGKLKWRISLTCCIHVARLARTRVIWI